MDINSDCNDFDCTRIVNAGVVCSEESYDANNENAKGSDVAFVGSERVGENGAISPTVFWNERRHSNINGGIHSECPHCSRCG